MDAALPPLGDPAWASSVPFVSFIGCVSWRLRFAMVVPRFREGWADFSPCGRYRWWLARRWDPARPRLLFIGLNPSAAGADRDDPTVRRLGGFAAAGGFGALEVVNLFARISVAPAALRRSADPVGSVCDRWIRARLLRLAGAPQGSAVALGWGNGGAWRGRDRQMQALLEQVAPAPPLLCLGVTAAGQPRHPLYLPSSSSWQCWAPASAGRCQREPSAASWAHRSALPIVAPCPARPAAITCT